VNRRALQFVVAAFLGSKRAFCSVQNTITCFVTSLQKPGKLDFTHAALNAHAERQKSYVIVSPQSHFPFSPFYALAALRSALMAVRQGATK